MSHQMKCYPRLFSAPDLWGGTHLSFRELPCQLPAVWWGSKRSALAWVLARPRRMKVLWPLQGWGSIAAHGPAGWVHLPPLPRAYSAGRASPGLRDAVAADTDTGRRCRKTFEKTASTRMWDACLKADQIKVGVAEKASTLHYNSDFAINSFGLAYKETVF